MEWPGAEVGEREARTLRACSGSAEVTGCSLLTGVTAERVRRQNAEKQCPSLFLPLLVNSQSVHISSEPRAELPRLSERA